MFDLGLMLKSLSSRLAFQTRLIQAIAAMHSQLFIERNCPVGQGSPCEMRELSIKAGQLL
jgi:hypothetical protein